MSTLRPVDPVNVTMRAYAKWADICEDERTNDFQRYVTNIAEARYVVRRVLRIVDEEAKKHGLEPLLHQALLQIAGHDDGRGISITELARRLGVAATFVSRMVTRLEAAALVRRRPAVRDRRTRRVTVTPLGMTMLSGIDEEVHFRVGYMRDDFTEHQRVAALSIFAFYVGLDASTPIATAIRHARSAAENAAATSTTEGRTP